MKIVAIGDTHGRSTWKRIVEKEKDADRIIFIGDYFDTFDGALRGKPEADNFQNIVNFKRENPEQVVLLIGNHDFHYMDFAMEQYSGYNSRFAMTFSKLLYDASDVMQMCHIEEGHIFTHAGVTKRWLLDNEITPHDINSLFKTNPSAFRFYPGDRSGYGENWHQSPIWVRPSTLQDESITEYAQVVGHTHQPTIFYYHGTDSKIVYIDCLDNCDEYLTIIDGKYNGPSL